MTNIIIPLQLLLSNITTTFLKHTSGPLCARRLKRMTAMLVEKKHHNLLSNKPLLWAMLPHDAIERLVGVLSSTSQALL